MSSRFGSQSALLAGLQVGRDAALPDMDQYVEDTPPAVAKPSKATASPADETAPRRKGASSKPTAEGLYVYTVVPDTIRRKAALLVATSDELETLADLAIVAVHAYGQQYTEEGGAVEPSNEDDLPLTPARRTVPEGREWQLRLKPAQRKWLDQALNTSPAPSMRQLLRHSILRYVTNHSGSTTEGNS